VPDQNAESAHFPPGQYRVTFRRTPRTVPPLILGAEDADDLLFCIESYAKRRLWRDCVNKDGLAVDDPGPDGSGKIAEGERRMGEYTIHAAPGEAAIDRRGILIKLSLYGTPGATVFRRYWVHGYRINDDPTEYHPAGDGSRLGAEHAATVHLRELANRRPETD
jgi:hypothetical protein